MPSRHERSVKPTVAALATEDHLDHLENPVLMVLTVFLDPEEKPATQDLPHQWDKILELSSPINALAPDLLAVLDHRDHLDHLDPKEIPASQADPATQVMVDPRDLKDHPAAPETQDHEELLEHQDNCDLLDPHLLVDQALLEALALLDLRELPVAMETMVNQADLVNQGPKDQRVPRVPQEIQAVPEHQDNQAHLARAITVLQLDWLPVIKLESFEKTFRIVMMLILLLGSKRSKTVLVASH
jgi:hypothetical protein